MKYRKLEARALRIVRSCETLAQLEVARNYCEKVARIYDGSMHSLVIQARMRNFDSVIDNRKIIITQGEVTQ